MPRELGAALGDISRSELFAVLYVAGILNAVAAVIFTAIHSEGIWGSFRQVPDVDVLLLASAVGIYLLRQAPEVPMERRDWLTAGIFAFLLLIPHWSASWAAVTALALYAMCRDCRSPTTVAASSIFVMIAVSSYWGWILTHAFASTLLAWDAALAAALLDVLTDGGVERIGNLIVTPDQATLFVMIGCSFLPNLLYGFLSWTVIARVLRPAWRLTDLFALLAVAGLVLTANTLRLALMGLSGETYEWLHGPVGSNVFNVGLIILIAIVALHSTAPAAPPLRRQRNAAGREPAR